MLVAFLLLLLLLLSNLLLLISLKFDLEHLGSIGIALHVSAEGHELVLVELTGSSSLTEGALEVGICVECCPLALEGLLIRREIVIVDDSG